ncbi:MAG: S41 family peptidase, partial [Acidobacteria bacterium]|nr:S41 family peptidase [Acidobacteriota bacterium]
VWGEPRKVLLEDSEGREFEYEVTREAGDEGRVDARRLASGFGYVKFRHWVSPAARRFREELWKMADAPGLVIDLRGNGGGQTDALLDIAGNFFAAPTYYGGFRKRDGALDKYFTRRHARAYAAPVVVITDTRSASASETFALFMQEAGRAAVVGRQTAGSTNNARVRPMRGGGTLAYSVRAYVTPRGRNPEGEGVVPDEVVPLTLSDLRRGRDAALEAAENRLRKR